MTANWLWDRKITETEAKKVLRKPEAGSFLSIAALLLSRNNTPRDVLKKYLDPVIFCKYWLAIKRKMRQDKWNEPRIIFWQAIYEKLADKNRRKGVVFKKKPIDKEPCCEAIGKKIAGIRREQGLCQKDLARKLGVSQQLISRIEKGGENISLGVLTNISKALKKNIEINFLEFKG